MVRLHACHVSSGLRLASEYSVETFVVRDSFGRDLRR